MLLYWFRYTCLLILQTRTAARYAGRMAEANRLNFPAVKEQLESDSGVLLLDPLRRSLDSDYRILTYLAAHASQLGVQSIEQKLLMADYQVMRVWYALVKGRSDCQARSALKEMSDILTCYAGAMGERVASFS